MAGTALLTDRHGRVDGSLTQSQLVVRLVATSAISVKGAIIHLLGAVLPLIQVIEDIIVARYALTHVERVWRQSVDIGWFGMRCLISRILVAVQTTVLAMGGHMVPVGIQIP
jgi:hypothetical protein